MKILLLRGYGIFLILFAGWNSLYGQKMTRKMYIEQYKGIAIEEMKRSGIPASITLAQGILESNCGNSTLAIKGNNHFGIKCHKEWNGAKMYHDDDARGECFRKYKSADDSYRDHTDFLMNTSRYDFLFDLKPNDYKGWAKGLKKAGYATSSSYAEALIKIIEEEQLYVYDEGNKHVPREKQVRPKKHGYEGDEFQFNLTGRTIYEINRAEYIIGKEGDTFYKLAEELQMMPWEIIKYNELSKDSSIKDGQRVYIQPKRNKAAHGSDFHFVEEDESLYDISQNYAIKLSSLRKKNHLKEGQEPQVGDKLYLRKKNKEVIIQEEQPVNEDTDIIIDEDEEEVPVEIAE